MHLEWIQISNLRGLGVGAPLTLDLRSGDGALPRWTVVVGPNGAGKSTLLRAIALVCSGVRTCLPLQPKSAWWVSRGPEEDRPLGHHAVAARVVQGPADVWSPITPRASGSTLTLALMLDAHRYVQPDDRNEISATELKTGPWKDQDDRTGWFIAGYGPYRRLGRGSRASEELRKEYPRPTARLLSLFWEDVALVEPLAWLENLEFQYLKKRKAAQRLRPRIIELLSDGLLRGPSGAAAKIVAIEPEGLIIRENNVSLPLTELSDGYQTVIGLVLDLMHQLHQSPGGVVIERDERSNRCTVRNEGIVLIDEVESHLHPSWQRRIGGWLTERFPNIQFIVATHSPFICQEAARNGVIIRLTRPDESVPARVLGPDDLGHVLNGTADDIYLSGLFGIDSVRSEEAERDLRRAADLRGRIRRGQADAAEAEEYRRITERMPPSSELMQSLKALGLEG